jgi:hypothetical protein
MSRSRASRRERVRGRGARLRARDLDILLALAKMRLLRTSALSRLFFVGKGTCQKRLRKLFDAGLVRAAVTGLAEENRFSLTKLGHALVREALPEGVVPEYRPPPRVDQRSVQHLDLLNEYRIALALGLRAQGLELRGFTPDWELRSRDSQAGLVPDALIELAKPRSRTQVMLALEVDTGSETPGIVVKKVTRYRERRALGQTVFGVVPEVVLFVVRTERRARSLARSITLSGGEGSPPIVLLGVERDLLEDGGVSNGLRRPKEVLDGVDAGTRPTVEVGLRLLLP